MGPVARLGTPGYEARADMHLVGTVSAHHNYWSPNMNIALLLLVLLLLFGGGGGFYLGGPAIGGGVIGLIVLIAIIVYFAGGFRARS